MRNTEKQRKRERVREEKIKVVTCFSPNGSALGLNKSLKLTGFSLSDL
jgi:hypothetical protein